MSGPRWVLKVFLLAIFGSVFFAGGLDLRFVTDSPDAANNSGTIYGYPSGYFEKIEDPWVDLTKLHRTGSHDAKLNLRLTVPVTLHYLGLRARWILPALTIGAICAILLLSCLIAFRLTGDRVTSFFVTVGVAATYTGSFAVVSYYDAIAIAQLTLALMPGLNAWAKGLLVFTASFTDERAFCASAFLLVPALCPVNGSTTTLYSRLRSAGFIAVIAGMSAYILGRILLLKFAHLSTPLAGVSWSLFLDQIRFLHVGAWFALEGGWLLAALALLVLLRRRCWPALAMLLATTMVLLAGSLMVADVLRSASFVFPVLMVSLIILSRAAEIGQLRFYCFLGGFISLAGGNYNVYGDQITYFEPEAVTLFGTLCRAIFVSFHS